MAQAPQALTIAPRYQKPAAFNGTDTAWRVLCDLYPAAETPEVIMAVTEYCAVRRLDPFKRPVHVVPMYNAKLRRKVQVVMQGINEIEITASRTQRWAGLDLPVWGKEVDRTFRGSFENDDGTTTTIEKTMRFPLWCAVTVWKLVSGERRPFTEQLFWEECYGRAGFRSEVPNARWQQAPRQMLHKCTKAAVLRAAFPEEGFGFAAEEMEDHEIDAGGITIDGKVDHGTADMANQPPPRSTRRDQSPARTDDDPLNPLASLDEQNGTKWLANLMALLTKAASVNDVIAIAGHHRVRKALTDAPTLYRAQINDALKAAHERLAPPPGGPADDDREAAPGWDDPLAELLADVGGMDLITIAGLPSNASWRAKVRDLFPPDEDRLNEAIAARKAALERTKR